MPTKPIRFIVPSSPGGAADATTRVVADGVSKLLGQRIVVENRAGASGNIGSDFVARAAADGYTWLMINNAQAANVRLFKNLTYDLLRDFAAFLKSEVDGIAEVVRELNLSAQ
jgi:tripartite-type tricarboxylate transporter receptor subunit TctC